MCNKLNAENLFDKPIELQENDRLLISIHFKGNEYSTNYGFEFKKGKWRVVNYDMFDWAYKHEELKQGKLKNVMAKMPNKLTEK